MKKTMNLICLAVCILLASCNGATDTNTSSETTKPETDKSDMRLVRAEIQAIENAWAEAMTKRDINAIMALYTDDVKSMQDGGPTLNGKAALQAQMEKDFGAPPRYASISFTTQDVYGTPDEVTEVGTSSEKDASGKETATGKYIAVFKKVDGSYKCVREIYNKDSN